tara:strand:+ start:796 stop:1047 length:252 start_codon:yes stop_codon:yes gene_type:complete
MYLNLDDNEFDSFAGDKNKSVRKEKRIAEALLMGGAAEMRAMKAIRRKCKEMLATARFSSRAAQREALKDCIMQTREQLLGGV